MGGCTPTVLVRTTAILRYLCNSRAVPDHWYPADPRLRARCDAALDWHHSTLRRGAAALVFVHYMLPMRNGGKPLGLGAEKTAKEALSTLKLALTQLEHFWLAGRRFITGDAVSIADLILANELTQLPMLDNTPTSPHKAAELLAESPRVRQWLADTRAATQPHWDAVHAKLNALAQPSTSGTARL